RSLQAAVFVEDQAFRDQRCPGQEVGEALGLPAVLGEVQHDLASCAEMRRVAHMPAYYVDEQRITLGCPHCRRMADHPKHEPGDPQAKPEADRGRERAVEDRDSARRAGQQDRFGQRPVHRRLEIGNQVVPDDVHYTSAPPPKEKNDRKNDEAVNAIDRPNTTWIRRRNPPAVSPNARVRPVTMMMMTATIFETGPSIDCRICCSGCSHGMFDPAATAGAAVTM